MHLEYKAKTHIVKNNDNKKPEKKREKKIKLKESVNWETVLVHINTYSLYAHSISISNIEKKTCTEQRSERSKQR